MTWPFSVVDTTPPTVTSNFPANGAVGISILPVITVTFSEGMSAASITSSSIELRDPLNVPVPSSVTYNSATFVATLKPSASLASQVIYSVIVHGGTVDPRVKDLAGNALAADFTWSFTTADYTRHSIWSPTDVPAIPALSDTRSGEVGVRFQASVSGYITAIRFYKGSCNFGPHIVNLWTNTGTLLATTTPTDETSVGWQEVPFSAPVAITAGTTYVASYFLPFGCYSVDAGFFTSSLTVGPLTLPANGLYGPNGTYIYASSSTFPNQDAGGNNYWVDVVFAANAIDTVPPKVTSVAPLNTATRVSRTTTVTVTFSENMDPATVTTSTFTLRNKSTVVAATVTYNSATRTATLTPTSTLAFTSTYTLTVKGGTTDPRVKDLGGNSLSMDFTSWFTTTSASPTQGPGGPILVITTSANPFTTYYAEILRAEGLNSFAVADIAAVTSTTLASYDVVVLGQMILTSTQVTMFTTWVNGGGQLIAMRPDKQLTGLLGLTNLSSTLSDGYLLLDRTQAAAKGLVTETIQFHGTADKYSLSGATSLATLYSDATTATTNPAVVKRAVGTSGGQAAAFTYDLAQSVILIRQGNPAWSGQHRSPTFIIQPFDLFYGAAPFDPKPDWTNPNKIQIPQADEQQRLLANLILTMNQVRRPLPRFAYFPRGTPAVVVMTGDDHATGGTAGRFDNYKAGSPTGCIVDNWECVRSTSYIYPASPIEDPIAAAYVRDGFEVALHVHTNCANWTPATLESFYSSQLSQFAAAFPSVPAPKTNRTHCVAWTDYDTQPQTEVNHGIRLDTTYYPNPPSWSGFQIGLLTGSGMPMRFATRTGAMVDNYQAATQWADDAGQTYPDMIRPLLDRAVGPEGYYGAFVANMHTDYVASAGSDAIIAAAKSRGVPIVSSEQMLMWLDGRNASTIGSVTWNGTNLAFSVTVAGGANGLQGMVPIRPGLTMTNLTLNGLAVSFTTTIIKGIQYAVFAALDGSYQATFISDTIPPTVTSVLPLAGSFDSDSEDTVSSTFSEWMNGDTMGASTVQLKNSSGIILAGSISYDVRSKTVTLVPTFPLSPGSYTATIKAGVKDLAGNSMTADYTWSFVTKCPCSMWNPGASPANPSAADAIAAELGVKFRSDVAGSITAIRFYKNPTDTGTHVVNLWTADGILLSTATVVEESASGWQQTALPVPIAILANTTYVASFHTSLGHYSFDIGYFLSRGVDSPPLHALSDSSSGGNGVYLYGTGGFPTNTYSGTNFWVDVIFQ